MWIISNDYKIFLEVTGVLSVISKAADCFVVMHDNTELGVYATEEDAVYNVKKFAELVEENIVYNKRNAIYLMTPNTYGDSKKILPMTVFE